MTKVRFVAHGKCPCEVSGWDEGFEYQPGCEVTAYEAELPIDLESFVAASLVPGWSIEGAGDDN